MLTQPTGARNNRQFASKHPCCDLRLLIKVRPMPRVAIKACRAHCNRCSRHFVSDEALALHLLDDGGCLDPDKREDLFEPWTEDGECRRAKGLRGYGKLLGVTVWAEAGWPCYCEEAFCRIWPVAKRLNCRFHVVPPGLAHGDVGAVL